MEENEQVNPDYLKGFNQGYELSKLAPEIAEVLSKAESTSEKVKGFKDGHKEFLIEKEKDYLPEWLENLEPSQTNDKKKEKDDLERE